MLAKSEENGNAKYDSLELLTREILMSCHDESVLNV